MACISGKKKHREKQEKQEKSNMSWPLSPPPSPCAKIVNQHPHPYPPHPSWYPHLSAYELPFSSGNAQKYIHSAEEQKVQTNDDEKKERKTSSRHSRSNSSSRYQKQQIFQAPPESNADKQTVPPLKPEYYISSFLFLFFFSCEINTKVENKN